VQQYLPDGTPGETIAVGTRCVACVCLGGENMDTLFISTGRKDLNAKELAAQPSAGGLFSAKIEGRGLLESRFGQLLF
jgi:L-arabinonolactonase